MNIEYEAACTNIEKESVRGKLRAVGAQLVKPEFLQRRVTFKFPEGHEVVGGWARVRDEGDKITMSVKVVNGEAITDQHETYLEISSFQSGVDLLKTLGCREKSYQETKRELWRLDGVEVTIDEWPFLEPFVEIEGANEALVKGVAEKLNFDWAAAHFGAVTTLYSQKYNMSEEKINNHTPRIVFDMENPFLS